MQLRQAVPHQRVVRPPGPGREDAEQPLGPCDRSEASCRSVATAAVATRQPSPSSPSRSASGTAAPSRNTSQKLVPPVSCRIGRTSTPDCRMGTRNAVSPRCFGASGSVRTSARPRSANRPLEVQIFCPDSRHPSPSRTPRVRTDARSDPASGSDSNAHATSSPRCSPRA
nr:hypothetical protein [Actinophytocola sp.]